MNKLNKVIEITLMFWLMKIIATTLGETLGDFISITSNLGYTAGLLITMLFFAIVLSVQLFSKKYVPLFYWLVIIGTTTLGTEISDYIDRTLHLGYTLGSVLLFTCLMVTFFFWYKKFKNLEFYPIYDKSKELFYWTAILFSNSLGTAFGDYLYDNLGLSYITGAAITAGVILVLVVLHYLTKKNQILLFWAAFIFTRPFGAAFGDFLTKPTALGGLDLGTFPASAVSIILLSVLIFISHKKHNNNVQIQ